MTSKNIGHIFISKNDSYPWYAFMFKYKQIAMDIVCNIYSYSYPPRSINTEMGIINNSIIYTFRDENGSVFYSSMCSVKDGPPTIETGIPTIYPIYKHIRFSFNWLLEKIINSKNIIDVFTDFLNGQFSLTPIDLYNLETSYTLRIDISIYYGHYQISPLFKTFPDIKNKRINEKSLYFNLRWTIQDVCTESINRDIKPDDISFPIFNSIDNEEYVPLTVIRSLMKHKDTTTHIKRSGSGIVYRKDYSRRHEIDFEDRKLVCHSFKAKDTWFIKLISLPKYLILSFDVEYKILAMWIIKNLK